MARILIVEDEMLIGMALEAALKAEGYETRHVTDGQKALAALEEFHPDVILTDYMMPRMDGEALIQAVRSKPDARETPIILMSAIPEETFVAKETDYDLFLQKAFRYTVLLEMLERVLDNGDPMPDTEDGGEPKRG